MVTLAAPETRPPLSPVADLAWLSLDARTAVRSPHSPFMAPAKAATGRAVQPPAQLSPDAVDIHTPPLMSKWRHAAAASLGVLAMIGASTMSASAYPTPTSPPGGEPILIARVQSGSASNRVALTDPSQWDTYKGLFGPAAFSFKHPPGWQIKRWEYSTPDGLTNIKSATVLDPSSHATSTTFVLAGGMGDSRPETIIDVYLRAQGACDVRLEHLRTRQINPTTWQIEGYATYRVNVAVNRFGEYQEEWVTCKSNIFVQLQRGQVQTWAAVMGVCQAKTGELHAKLPVLREIRASLVD